MLNSMISAVLALLGALITFSSSPWYEQAGDGQLGVSAMSDQQVAGALLWTAGLPVFLVVIGVTVARAAKAPSPAAVSWTAH